MTGVSCHVKPNSDLIKLEAVKDALVSGSSASVASTVTLSICSKLEEDSAAGAINGPSQWVWGEHEAYTRRATWRHTAVGYTIHHASSIFWALFYEHLFGRSRKRDLQGVSPVRIAAEAGAIAGIAYVIDYYVVPKRLRPGFKKHLGPMSIFATYAAFAAGLAATTWGRKRSKPGAHEGCRIPRRRNVF